MEKPSARFKGYQLREDGSLIMEFVEIVSDWGSMPPGPPHIRDAYRLIFRARDGKIVAAGREDAKIIPAMPERIEWPESE